MLISKFAKDMNGKSVDLKNDEVAYQVLCGIKARDREGKCVVANMNGKSTIFMISKDINVDKNNRNWHKVIPLVNLPVHADGTPFYESGTVFGVKSTFAELYHEEDSTDYHGAFAGVEMREVFMPVIENPQKSVSNAVEKGLRKQADFRVEEGRTSDGYAYNTIRILDPDMSETDRDYCKLVVSSGCMETIYSSDGRAKYTVNEEQKREIEAGAAHGKPTRNYYDTLVRSKAEFVARGMPTFAINAKLAERRKAMDSEYLAMINSPDFSVYKYYKATKKDTGELLQVFSTQENIMEPLSEVDFLDTYDFDEYEVSIIKKQEYEDCKDILKQKEEEKLAREKVFTKDDLKRACDSKGVLLSDLTEFTVPDGFTKIDMFAFAECKSLKEVTFPDSIDDMGGNVFTKCESLEKVNNFPRMNVICTGTFYGCKSLKRFDIPDGVTAIGTCAFSGCTALEEIRIPDGATDIWHGAFEHCDSLKRVITNKYTFDEIKDRLPKNCMRFDFDDERNNKKAPKKSGKKDFSGDVIDTDIIDKNDVIKSVKKDASKDRSSEADDIINDNISTDKNTPAD